MTQWITDDLEFAAKNAPEVAPDLGRYTRDYARFCLMKHCLNEGEHMEGYYQRAMDMYNELNTGKYDLFRTGSTPYVDLFKNANKFNKEIIMAVSCSPVSYTHLDVYKRQGEGYFEVRRNEKLPFFVKTKDLQLQVLGTKFNFRDYPEDHEVVVSLLEGKVELNNLLKKEKEAILAPDERAILNKTNGRMTVETVTASNASQWTDGYLFFDEELLPDIVKELERSYLSLIHI